MDKLNKYLNIAKKDLFYLCRSITGEGVRKTFKVMKKHFLSLELKELNLEQKFLIGKFLLSGM